MSRMERWGSKSYLDLANLTLQEEPASYADDPEEESHIGSTSTLSQKEGNHLKSRSKKKKEEQDPATVNMYRNIKRSSSSYKPEQEPGDLPAESSPQTRKKSTRSSSGGSTRVGFNASVTRYSETGEPENGVIKTKKNKHPKRKTKLRRTTEEYRAAEKGKPIYPGK